MPEKHDVRIHINQKPHESPNPTTGTALYALGHVSADQRLYREVTGDHEDPMVPNGPEHIHLMEDEHFHSGPPKEFTVIVNGRQKTVAEDELCFNEIIALAFTNVPQGENIVFTITYRKGVDHKEGTVVVGRCVKIKDGMIFNVTATDKS